MSKCLVSRRVVPWPHKGPHAEKSGAHTRGRMQRMESAGHTGGHMQRRKAPATQGATCKKPKLPLKIRRFW